MRKIIYIVLLFTQVFWAQDAFEKGNELYQKGNYEQAASVYQNILDSGHESAEVYFNLGNCFYKLRQTAPAIYNFEKALQLEPNDCEILNNLGFAQKMTIDHIEEVPKLGFSKLFSDSTSLFHYDTWAWLSVVFAFMALLGFSGYYFSNTTTLKRVFFSGMLFSLLFVILSVFAGFFEKNRLEKESPAIVFAEEIIVKSEPNASAPDAFTLHEGTKVYALETVGNYKKIQLLNQKEGWIVKSAIKELK
ncbi:tetratricopeptide repeat protein [Flavobacterium amniphilum]|uniref:tetratricopeptide repeat protein n=1 Tax=Flavobacterium amniphilum TaxID=1834035 RepID=UPI002029E3DE|nr:tetratricopeptide repeat protein [Flavobacterium amniphilum]MCL9805926.1 tetratricopeptide repeat protein [Flavobacterium amniphilum]